MLKDSYQMLTWTNYANKNKNKIYTGIFIILKQKLFRP